jgi:hypothetical protein
MSAILKLINLLLIIAMPVNCLRAQQSKVVLSNLEVINYFEDKPEITKVSVMFDVTDIDRLTTIKIEASETSDFFNPAVFSFQILHKEDKYLINLGKDGLLPISGNPKVIFIINVPDQMKEPYYYFRLSGSDADGLMTNSIDFNKN